MAFTISDLICVVVAALAVCVVLSLGPAARAGDKINAMVNAAKYEHDDGEQ